MESIHLVLEILTAVGTVSATAVALWLGLRENLRRVDSTFIWEPATSYQPTLLVQNTSNRIVVIESIRIKYRSKEVCSVDFSRDFSFGQYAIIEARQIHKIPMNKFQFKFPDGDNSKKKYKLEVIIKQRNGRSCISATKYSCDELQERFFGQYLFEE